jgi:hypothetical protein
MKQINDKEFSMNTTTKEQYLKFKKEIKSKSHAHAFYIAYYIFKHRIGKDSETDLVDPQVIEKYLDDVVIPACHKGLYCGYITGTGGDCINYSIKLFKEMVRYYYNTYAEPQDEK